MARQDFLSEFVLRELLAALGAPLPASKAPADSFSESLSEESESQANAAASSAHHSRVLLVRRTNSSQRRVTLVDRHFDVEAFVPKHVSDFLQQTRGYQTLGRLRGSVVRVTKYHFATLTRCLAADERDTETSVSLSTSNADRARVYLYVDALAIVEENDLAADFKPDVYSHSAVAERLQSLSAAELEKQLMIHQGLPPLGAVGFDDERPLLEEDCVIPEDQEQELEEQDGWGPPTTVEKQPTDSELIEENGSVPMLESQVVRGPASPDKTLSTQDSVMLSGNPSVGLSDEASVKSSLDSQRFAFQQENIQETFVVGSDTDEEDSETLATQKAAPNTPKAQGHAGKKNSPARSSPVLTTPTKAQDSYVVVDLTGDSPEKAASVHQQKQTQNQEPKVEAIDFQEELVSETPVLPTQETPQKSQKSPKTQTPAGGWNTLIDGVRKFASGFLGTPSAEDSNENSRSPGRESDEPATQLLEQPEEEKETKDEQEDKRAAEPEEFISSQATVMLQYSMDNDEYANAFEYEGMLSDDMASPRSVQENDTPINKGASSTDDQAPKEGGDGAVTPQKKSVSKENDTDFKTPSPSAQAVAPQKKSVSKEGDAEFKTPSPSTQAMTPGTEKRTNVTEQQQVDESTVQLDSGRRHPVSPPKEPVVPSNPSTKQSPYKSPPNLVISVGSARNGSNQEERSSFPSDASRGTKRPHQQTTSSEALSGTTNARQGGIASADELETQPITGAENSRPTAQKRRRREILRDVDGGSQSPQFEQPALPRRRVQPGRENVVSNSYSLSGVCRSRGSHATEENQARTPRQPRRAWKRYEHLFPSLNMTRLKQMMAEGNDK